jgi:hypothetical protein
MVRHIMMAMRTTDRFAAPPRWSTTVSADARLKTYATTMQVDPKARCGAKHRFTLSAMTPPMPSDSICGFKNQPAAALKSP